MLRHHVARKLSWAILEAPVRICSWKQAPPRRAAHRTAVPARVWPTVRTCPRRDLLLGAWSGEPDRAPIIRSADCLRTPAGPYHPFRCAQLPTTPGDWFLPTFEEDDMTISVRSAAVSPLYDDPGGTPSEDQLAAILFWARYSGLRLEAYRHDSSTSSNGQPTTTSRSSPQPGLTSRSTAPRCLLTAWRRGRTSRRWALLARSRRSRHHPAHLVMGQLSAEPWCTPDHGQAPPSGDPAQPVSHPPRSNQRRRSSPQAIAAQLAAGVPQHDRVDQRVGIGELHSPRPGCPVAHPPRQGGDGGRSAAPGGPGSWKPGRSSSPNAGRRRRSPGS